MYDELSIGGTNTFISMKQQRQMKVGKQGIYREHETIKARIIEAAPVQDHERERLDQQEDFVFDEDS